MNKPVQFKTAAILGVRSMLGSAIAAELERKAVSTIAVGRSQKDDIFVDLSLASQEVPPFKYRADVLFHCASSFYGDDDEGERLNIRINAESAEFVCEIASRLGVKTIIYAGSAFSDKESQEKYGSYGFSKYLAEERFSKLSKLHNFSFGSFRFPQIYDTLGKCCVHQPWFGRIIAYASRGLELRLPNSMSPRNYIHVEDAAAVMVAGALRAEAGVLPISHPESFTADRLADLAYEVFGAGGRAVIAEEKPPFRAIRFMDGVSNMERLGVIPRSMRAGLEGILSAGTSGAFGPLDVK